MKRENYGIKSQIQRSASFLSLQHIPMLVAFKGPEKQLFYDQTYPEIDRLSQQCQINIHHNFFSRLPGFQVLTRDTFDRGITT